MRRTNSNRGCAPCEPPRRVYREDCVPCRPVYCPPVYCAPLRWCDRCGRTPCACGGYGPGYGCRPAYGPYDHGYGPGCRCGRNPCACGPRPFDGPGHVERNHNMGCLPGCRCARCYTPCYDPCPGGWTNFRSGSCCQPVLFDAFLGGRHYPIATGTVTVTVATSNGIFVSSPNPTIANQAALLVWLNGVLVEAANVGFSSFGNFTAVGGYLMPARIGNTCVTGLTPILTT